VIAPAKELCQLAHKIGIGHVSFGSYSLDSRTSLDEITHLIWILNSSWSSTTQPEQCDAALYELLITTIPNSAEFRRRWMPKSQSFCWIMSYWQEPPPCLVTYL
jgi:hypothetical protein